MMHRLVAIMLLCMCCEAFDEEPGQIMFPNERSTLDDCHLRYFKLDMPAQVSPAFGLPTRFREFPHMAAIGWTDPEDGGGTIRWQCGGSLVWDNFVLTAAHCVLDSRSLPPDVVRLGDLNLYSADDDQYAQQFRIAAIVRHPEHRFASSYHDIALLKLDRNVTLDETVVPACLWTDEEVRFRELIATGWGSTGFAEEHTPNLLKVLLKPMDTAQCSLFYPVSKKLRWGLLQSQHLCAVDEQMDTCEGDSGGPLQVKLLHNSRMTPFLVGVISFGSTCGVSNPGVYTRISEYHDWIVTTMRQQGAVGIHESYNETLCALRFAEYRDFDEQVVIGRSENYTSVDSTRTRIYAGSAPEQMVQIGWNSGGPDCYGVIVDEDTVLTVTDCTSYGGVQPAFITYLDNKTMPIAKIHDHPDFVRGSAYSNIAIIKLLDLLDLPLGFQPSCIYHKPNIEFALKVYGNGRLDINRFLSGGSPAIDPTESIHVIKPQMLNESDCIVSQRYRPRLQHGLTREHLCLGNDVFQVPRSCDLLVGSVLDEWLVKDNNIYHHTMALSLLGRDCGFGEHLIATRLASHVDWLKSVLLPDQLDASNVVHFVDQDLSEGNSCSVDDRQAGICVKMNRCSVPWKEHVSRGLVTFCTTSSVICCPVEAVGQNNNSLIHPNIYSCSKFVASIPRKTFLGSRVLIGWIEPQTVTYRCAGTIINKFMIVTTTSCLDNTIPDLIQPVNSSSEYPIDAILQHPNYNSTDHTNDIALIRMSDPFRWSSMIYPACLWTNQTHTPIVMSTIHPAGATDVESTLVHPMYNSDCQRTHPYRMQASQLCTRNPNSITSCTYPTDQLYWMDSNRVGFLVGLAPSYAGCVQRKYAIFTRISAYLEWISENAS
uniref:Putative trypsin-like serine protease n=1 Tax=Culex tarsalis TaxID=7177 RepID=A0A1Q3FJF4_CULTA